MHTGRNFMKNIGLHRRALLLLLGIVSLLSQPLLAQDDVLKPVGGLDLGDIFGEETKKATARQLSQTDETLNIAIEYQGFTEADQYIIRGEVLNSDKKAIKEIPPVKRPASKGSGSVDLGFQLKVDAGSSFDQAYLNSAFVKISIYNAKAEENGDVFELPGGETVIMSGNSYTFECEKKWRIGGNADMVIPVTLTPIGKAKN